MPDNSTRTSNGEVPGINSSYPSVPTREGANLQLDTDTDGISRISICPPKGYYPGSGRSYINALASKFGNAARNQVLSNASFTSSNGLNVTGSITSLKGGTITPTTYNKVYECTGKYMEGDITITGDGNLISDNIRRGKSIFGINGGSSILKYIEGSATSSSQSSTFNGYSWPGMITLTNIGITPVYVLYLGGDNGGCVWVMNGSAANYCIYPVSKGGAGYLSGWSWSFTQTKLQLPTPEAGKTYWYKILGY